MFAFLSHENDSKRFFRSEKQRIQRIRIAAFGAPFLRIVRRFARDDEFSVKITFRAGKSGAEKFPRFVRFSAGNKVVGRSRICARFDEAGGGFEHFGGIRFEEAEKSRIGAQAGKKNFRRIFRYAPDDAFV